MSVIIQSGFVGINEPLDHPRIGWRAITGDAIGTNPRAGFSRENALDPRTAIAWSPTGAAPAQIGVDAGESVTASYCGVAGHDLGTQNASVSVQRWTGSSWTNIIGSQLINRDDAILFLFAPVDASRFRLNISSADNPVRIGHVRFGMVTEIPRRSGYGGTTPISEGRRYDYDALRTNNGAFLGRSIVSTSLQFQVSVQHVSETWRASEWVPFREHANRGDATFFAADRPIDYPEDVAYAWSNEPVRAERGIANAAASIDFVLNCEAL